ncbi:MAG TPA: aminotransferase class IV [Fredinandcohnia sp.]|nr:aminotransferase class IV [Fredinandcohnia sp.]
MIRSDDRGFTLGDGAFETMRCRDGKVFRLRRHVDRLRRALDLLRITTPPDLLERIVEAARGPGERMLRVTVTRGPAPPGLMPIETGPPTVAILQAPIPPPPRELTARIVSGRRNDKAAGSGHKLLGYAEGILGLFEARDAGDDEALFLDTEGHLAEAAASNLFVVKGGRILTPPLGCGILPGITREIVLELEPFTEERVLWPRDLFEAEEVFLTSSIRGIVPLVRVDGHRIGRGAPGPITLSLAARWRRVIELELEGVEAPLLHH